MRTRATVQKKKSLGQHFLKEAKYLRAVADAAQITEGEAVVEIGPGEGTLTKELLARGARVIALEKDARLIPWLNVTFEKELRDGQLEVVEADALEWNVDAKAGHAGQNSGRPIRPARGILGGAASRSIDSYKVVGNIPYYITGALLRKFLSAQQQPSLLVFLIQKEVAERIVHPERSRGAKKMKESILSLSVKAYGTPKYVMSVPRGAFSPAPNVDSAILAVADISRKNFENRTHEEKFFELARAGFAQKRKLLRRNLETLLGPETELLMQQAGIPRDARAEDVPLEKWLILSRTKELALVKTI